MGSNRSVSRILGNLQGIINNLIGNSIAHVGKEIHELNIVKKMASGAEHPNINGLSIANFCCLGEKLALKRSSMGPNEVPLKNLDAFQISNEQRQHSTLT